MADCIKDLHVQVRKKLNESNKKYKAAVDKHRRHAEFKEGDLVWINLCKERFPRGKHGKLCDRADGPFHVLKRLGDNAYQIELLGDTDISASINVAELQPYYVESDNEDLDSESSLSQPGEFDGGPSKDPCHLDPELSIAQNRSKREIKIPSWFLQ